MLNTSQELIFTITSLLLSLACGLACIPYIIRFCMKKGLYDMPGARKVHKSAIPRLGGISFLPSMLLATVIVIAIYSMQNGEGRMHISPWTAGFFLSLLIIYTTGIIDDMAGLGARTKFVAQIIAAAILPLLGLYINNLYGFMGIHELSYIVGAPLTLFVVVFICNAINLIDGIDGLSAGLSFIALTGFLVCFWQQDMPLYCILVAGLMGVLLAFLYYNLFGNTEKHQKIFMGDSGSLSLGFILGFLCVKLSMHNPNVMDYRPDALLQAFTLVIVPVMDVMRVSLVRIRHRVPIFHADKNHIHHKLMRSGMTQHQALLAIYALAIGYIALNALLYKLNMQSTTIVATDVAVWLAFHQTVNHRIRKAGEPVYLPNPDKD